MYYLAFSFATVALLDLTLNAGGDLAAFLMLLSIAAIIVHTNRGAILLRKDED